MQIWYNAREEKGDDIMSTLKELRIAKGLTQEQASVLLGVSLRSYKTYENDRHELFLCLLRISFCYVGIVKAVGISAHRLWIESVR